MEITQQQQSDPWFDEIKRYNKAFEKWVERSEKIIDIYIDQAPTVGLSREDSKFNILWSNIQSLKPAAFSKIPKPEVSRRFKDKDPVSRTACQIIERCLDYEITQYNDYNSSLSTVVDDRLLCGRGQAWIRYEPVIERQEFQISEDEQGEAYEVLASELSPVDYVYWKDFAHSPARTWEEVVWVARRVYMTKDEGLSRFGDAFEQVPLTSSSNKDDLKDAKSKTILQAEVWEIWDKASMSVLWIAKGYGFVLDTRKDPLQLCDFFPCPKPLFSTLISKSLVPTPDYVLYQDQAEELNIICQKIKQLSKALAVKGVYAGDDAAITRLLESGNNEMIPVTNWMQFAEKGGVSGVIEMWPLKNILEALNQLYQSREQCKQVIYEVTGISDIIRGASVASETATAQNIKSQYASLRLSAIKNEVARFARDLLRIKAEIICSKYQPQTLISQSGIDKTDDAQYIDAALQLIANEPMRNFSIDIETDSLVEIDENEEKAKRVEFLASASQFIEKSIPAIQQDPNIAPLLSQMLLFGIRSFKVGRDLEGAFEQYTEQLTQQIAQQKSMQDQMMAQQQMMQPPIPGGM